MLLENYRPKSCLVTKSTNVKVPRFPVIDIHNHLGDEFGGGWIHRPISELIDILDQAHIRIFVDLDGGWGEDILAVHIDKLKHNFSDRFRVFGGVDWDKWQSFGDAFPDWAANRLREQKRMGADGLKVWKNFGLKVRDQHGELVKVDDNRLGVIWETAGELGFPVMIHVADPVAFFIALDENNERWEELSAHPDWQFSGPPFPLFYTIIDGLANLVRQYPKTRFIGAHVGCYAENLKWVSNLLNQCPNFYVDISARIGELGRQPYSARKFFIEHADKILFGSDFGPDLDTYRIIFRFLESEDEYFNYNIAEVPQQGRWFIYGLNLKTEILEKVYNKNAELLLFQK
jgi:hypothetical protein